MLLEGYIEFENPLPVSLECLGKEYNIQIAGFDGVLATPNAKSNFKDDLSIENLRLLSPNQGEVDYIKRWGWIYSWPDGESQIKSFKILFKNISKKAHDITATKILKELENWRKLLIANISLMLEKNFCGTEMSIVSKDYGFREFGIFKKTNDGYKVFIPEELKTRHIDISLEKSLILDCSSLQQVLDDTSIGKKPLLPFYFLFDADRAIFDKNFRKSILDSATAVEVSFSSLISKMLPYNNELNKYIAAKHNSLRLKRELLKILNIQLDLSENDYKEGLDTIRNKVIHAGYSPTYQEANMAFKIAKQTCYTILPKKYEI